MRELKEFTLVLLSNTSHTTIGKVRGAVKKFIENGTVKFISNQPKKGSGGMPHKVYGITDKFNTVHPIQGTQTSIKFEKRPGPDKNSGKSSPAKEKPVDEPVKSTDTSAQDVNTVADRLRNLIGDLNDIVRAVNDILVEKNEVLATLSKERDNHKKLEGRAAAFDKLKELMVNA
jgi:predicted transcriptional regulator